MVATLPPTVDVPCLSEGADTPAELPGTIFAAHVKSRQEKAFARDLAQRGIGYYLPMCERVTKTSQGRRYIVEIPIFPGYVFFCGDVHTPAVAMSTGRVCRTFGISDQLCIRKELGNLFRAWQVNPRMELAPQLVKGQKVRITSGAFEGVEGIIVRRSRSAILVLDVSQFGQTTVDIEIAAEFVEVA